MADVIIYSKSFKLFFPPFWPHNFLWLQITVLQKDIINLGERTRSFQFGVFHGHFFDRSSIIPAVTLRSWVFGKTPVARFWCTGLLEFSFQVLVNCADFFLIIRHGVQRKKLFGKDRSHIIIAELRVWPLFRCLKQRDNRRIWFWRA